VLSALFVFLLVTPTQLIENGPTICVFRNLFGIECWGCGLTRAFSCLLHNNLRGALEYNKAVVVVFPVFCSIVIRDWALILRLLLKGGVRPLGSAKSARTSGQDSSEAGQAKANCARALWA